MIGHIVKLVEAKAAEIDAGTCCEHGYAAREGGLSAASRAAYSSKSGKSSPCRGRNALLKSFLKKVGTSVG